MECIFEVGDVVLLPSTSVKMTVSRITEKGETTKCHCVWFDEHNNLHEADFDARALKPTQIPK